MVILTKHLRPSVPIFQSFDQTILYYVDWF